MVYAHAQKPGFYAHIQRKSAFLEGFVHFLGNWAIVDILYVHDIYFHHSVGVAVGVRSFRNTGNAEIGIFEKIASMGKNDTFELLGSRIHSKCVCLGSKSLWCNVPGPHITPGNFYDHAEKRTTFIRPTRNISPPTLDKWRVNSTG